MHPRDEAQFRGQPVVGDPLRILAELTDVPVALGNLCRKWYMILATPNTDGCGADDRICRLIVGYASRAMKKGGVELDDAREFEVALASILEGPTTKCELCSEVRARFTLDKDMRTLSGEIVIPCKGHGKLSWEFKIGKGVGANG